MRSEFDHLENDLPDAFSQAERQVDRRLAGAARRAPVRIGLSQRVFQASVGHLPQRRLRLAGQSQPAVSRWTFGHLLGPRLSLAASVMIVCGLAAWFLRQPMQHDTRLVSSDMPADVEPIVFLMPVDSTSLFDSEVSHLLDTQDTSPEDIESELAMLIKLEM